MIPQKYMVENEETVEVKIVKGKDIRHVTPSVDTIAWLLDHEERLKKIKEGMLSACGAVLMTPHELTFQEGDKKVEMDLYDGNTRVISELAKIKDPEKQNLKIFEYIEFIVKNIFQTTLPSGIKVDADRRKQIIDRVLKKIEEEEKKGSPDPSKEKT